MSRDCPWTRPARTGRRRSWAVSSCPGTVPEHVRIGEDGVGQSRPGVARPVAEGEVGEAREGDADVGVDPEEGAAAAEVPERARRVARAGPVRGLPVPQLEADAPVVRLLPPEARQDAGEARELHA